eukprot:EG_transcript_9289
MKAAYPETEAPVGLAFHPILRHSSVNPVLPADFWVGFTVTIPRAWDFNASEKRRKVGYVIECHARCGFSWTVIRRYSDFVLLHQQLAILNRMVQRLQGAIHHRRAMGQPADAAALQIAETSLPRLPELPGTHWFQRTNHDDSRINRRRLALEGFLQHVVYTHLYFISGLLNDFLLLDVAHKVAKPVHLHVPLVPPRRLRAPGGPPTLHDAVDPASEVAITVTAATPPTHCYGFLQRCM